MANVNGVQVGGAVTTVAPSVAAIGSDANVDLQLSGQGTGKALLGATGAAAAVAGAATSNTQRGTITSEALTTAAGAEYALTLTNNKISAGSIVLASVQKGTDTIGPLCVTAITPGAGSVEIRVQNRHAANALNGTIVIAFVVL